MVVMGHVCMDGLGGSGGGGGENLVSSMAVVAAWMAYPISKPGRIRVTASTPHRPADICSLQTASYQCKY